MAKKTRKRRQSTPRKSARPRKARSVHYSEELRTPITVHSTGKLGDFFAAKEIDKARFQKLVLLLECHGIEASDEDRWFKLAMALAIEIYPGMQGINLATKRGRGGSKKWDESLC